MYYLRAYINISLILFIILIKLIIKYIILINFYLYIRDKKFRLSLNKLY